MVTIDVVDAVAALRSRSRLKKEVVPRLIKPNKELTVEERAVESRK
jgi:hypothetical protein